MVARPAQSGSGGKSELRRARRSVTRSPGNGKESAAERETTPFDGERVKRCPDLSGSAPQGAEGKSSPVSRVTGTAW